MQQILNYKKYGESGAVVIIIHGIFGMLDNWQYHAKLLSEKYQVISVDARNHGKSFHADTMSYEEMATDIIVLADSIGFDQFHLMGHSMGGKIAMKCAEMFPNRLSSLLVIDIAPKAYPPGHVPYFKAFLDLPLHTYESRAEVEKAFEHYAPELGVRQFLLKNLEIAPEGGYRTKSNMVAMKAFYEEIIGGFKLADNAYTGPCFFISGAKSGYLKDEDKTAILKAFPRTEFMQVSQAGHWVHADNPKEFYEKLLIALEG